MTSSLSTWLGAICMAAALGLPVHAQHPVPEAAKDADKPDARLEVDAVPERIAQQRRALAQQKEAIVQAYEQQERACWNKFAVNACLLEARRVRRKALEPLSQQELVLNAQERAWRVEQREKRLQDKQADNRGGP